MSPRLGRGLGTLAAAALIAACSGRPTPAPVAAPAAGTPWQGDPRTVLAAIDQRIDGITTLAAECRLTFRRPDKDPVSLQGALVAEPPERLRLRAWKLGHAVMDLTVRPDGVWLWTAKRADEATEKLINGELSSGPWRAVWPRLGSLLGDPNAAVERSGPNSFTVRGALPGKTGDAEGTLEAEIDGPSRTVRAYRLFEAGGASLGTLRLADYREIANQPWPGTLRAETSRGTLEVDLRDLTLDEPLPATAFEPPRRATRRD